MKQNLIIPNRFPNIPNNPNGGIIQKGLVAEYRCDQTSGLKLWDYSVFRNHGAITNATWTPQGLNFGGTAYVDCGNPSEFNLGTSTDITIHLIMQTATSNSNYAGLIQKADSNASWIGWQLLLLNNKLNLQMSDGSAPYTTYINESGTTVLNNNVVRSIILKINRSTNNAKIYIDKAVEIDVSHAKVSTSLTTAANLMIGTERTAGVFYKGNMYSILIYNRLTTTPEDNQNHAYLKSVLAPRGVRLAG